MRKLTGRTKKFEIDDAALQDMLKQIKAYEETNKPYQGNLDPNQLPPAHQMIVNIALTRNRVAEEHFFAPPEAIDQPKANPVSHSSGAPATPVDQEHVKFEADSSSAAGVVSKEQQEANDRKIAKTLAEEDDAASAQASEKDAEETTAQQIADDHEFAKNLQEEYGQEPQPESQTQTNYIGVVMKGLLAAAIITAVTAIYQYQAPLKEGVMKLLPSIDDATSGVNNLIGMLGSSDTNSTAAALVPAALMPAASNATAANSIIESNSTVLANLQETIWSLLGNATGNIVEGLRQFRDLLASNHTSGNTTTGFIYSLNATTRLAKVGEDITAFMNSTYTNAASYGQDANALFQNVANYLEQQGYSPQQANSLAVGFIATQSSNAWHILDKMPDGVQKYMMTASIVISAACLLAKVGPISIEALRKTIDSLYANNLEGSLSAQPGAPEVVPGNDAQSASSYPLEEDPTATASSSASTVSPDTSIVHPVSSQLQDGQDTAPPQLGAEMNAQQNPKSNVSFVGDPIKDSPELAAKRDALPDLEQNMFRVQYSGQKNESSHLRVVEYRPDNVNPRQFSADEEHARLLEQDKGEGFSPDQVRVDWRSDHEADLQSNIDFQAGYVGFKQAMQAMPDKKIKMKGCPSKEFFKGVVEAANELKKQRGLHECISDYNRLCDQFEVPIEAGRNRLGRMDKPPTGASYPGTPPTDSRPDPDNTRSGSGYKKKS